MAIIDIKHKGLKDLYTKGSSAKIGKRYVDNIWLILDLLQGITDPNDCQGIKDFHELKDNRKGTYSLHVTGNYCITFKWDGEHVTHVNFEDYH